MKKALILFLGISSVFPIYEPGFFEVIGILFLLLFGIKRNLVIDGFTQLFIFALMFSSFTFFSLKYNLISIFLIAIALVAKKQFKYYVLGLFLGLLVTLLLMEKGTWLGFRYQGFFKDPNLLANTAFLVLIQRRTISDSNLLNFIIFSSMIPLILLANSRAHTYVLALYLLIIFVQNISLPNVFLLIIISGILFYALSIPELPNIRLSNAGYEDGRLENWRNALGLISVYPLGVGAGMSAHYLGFNVHNIILQFFLENGLFAGVLFVLIVVYKARRRKYLWETVLYLLAATPFDVAHWRHLWIFLYQYENSSISRNNR